MKKHEIQFEVMKFLGIIKSKQAIKLAATINEGFSFSKDSSGKYIFESAFLSEGFRKGMNNNTEVFIPKSEIEKSINNPINKNFPIKFNHNYDTPSPGMVNKLYFDNLKQMLTATGVINVPEIAEEIRKLQEQKRIQVSVTVFGHVVWNTEKDRPELHDLRYNELSIVERGEVPNTYIKMK